jgi:hypothetical protein
MRYPKVIVLVGTNGTGKSTIQKKFFKYRQRNLVVPANLYDSAFDELEYIKSANEISSFEGTKKVFIEDENDFFNLIDYKNGLKDCGLFLDDFRNYIPASGPKLKQPIRKLFSDRRHRGMDIYLSTHSPRQIHPDIFAYQPIIFLFKTTEAFPDSLNQKIPNLEKLKIAQRRVNLMSKKNPYYFEIINND